MGSTFARAHANLYIGFFEVFLLFSTQTETYSSKNFLNGSVILMFQGAIHDWADFVHLLIGVNPDLKFSVEYDHKRVSFLDMWAE